MPNGMKAEATGRRRCDGSCQGLAASVHTGCLQLPHVPSCHKRRSKKSASQHRMWCHNNQSTAIICHPHVPSPSAGAHAPTVSSRYKQACVPLSPNANYPVEEDVFRSYVKESHTSAHVAHDGQNPAVAQCLLTRDVLDRVSASRAW